MLDNEEQLTVAKSEVESDEYLVNVVARHYDLLSYINKDKDDDINNIVEVGNATYRYSLSIPFTNPKGQKGNLFVILKNPSVATSQNADVTVSKVCHVAYNNGYSCVIIYNLFSYRGTNSTNLLNFFNSSNYAAVMSYNLGIITTNTNNKDVVYAWGTNTISSKKAIQQIYDDAINTLTSQITTSNVFNVRIKKSRYPLHGQRWSHDDKLV